MFCNISIESSSCHSLTKSSIYAVIFILIITFECEPAMLNATWPCSFDIRKNEKFQIPTETEDV